MTPEEMLAKLKIMTGKTAVEDEPMLSLYLETAGAAIIRKAYPYNPEITEVPTIYQMRQLEIATYLIDKIGAEGETAHNENGINRSYESGHIPTSLLKEVIPFGKVPKKEVEDEGT